MTTIQLERITHETEITLTLSQDKGDIKIQTGIAFFDHMLHLMCFYGDLSIILKAKGDLAVDDHHTVEDVGLLIGQGIKTLLSNRKGIARYGMVFMPMDEVLSRVVIDLSNRPVLHYTCSFTGEHLGEMSSQNIEEFFKSICQTAGITCHMACLYGNNDHHKAESLFKGFGMALKQAMMLSRDSIMSTKGVL